MVLGYHVVVSAYGFWLPNDPRGSWSEFVRSWELLRFGKATKVETLESVAAHAHNHAQRLAAKRALHYPPVRFTGVQARAVGRGFAALVTKTDLVVWACSILPEHVHLVIGRHRYPVEQVVNLLKGEATRQIVGEDLHPLRGFPQRTGRLPSMWGRGLWKVYLNDEVGIRRAIDYTEQNPVKEGKRRQAWSFVEPFD